VVAVDIQVAELLLAGPVIQPMAVAVDHTIQEQIKLTL
jgi:hypothetical protein